MTLFLTSGCAAETEAPSGYEAGRDAIFAKLDPAERELFKSIAVTSGTDAELSESGDAAFAAELRIRAGVDELEELRPPGNRVDDHAARLRSLEHLVTAAEAYEEFATQLLEQRKFARMSTKRRDSASIEVTTSLPISVFLLQKSRAAQTKALAALRRQHDALKAYRTMARALDVKPAAR